MAILGVNLTELKDAEMAGKTVFLSNQFST